ncbi:hypothetical protein MXD81_27935 [Microbacteriaceae bacterium K1510]|nr:hypothetical protein [Microbacteriaceae bacterium K1510]
MMLMVFSTVTGPGPESAGFAIFVFTVAAGGGVYYLIDGQDTVWLNRRDRFYRKLLAERELQEERSRKMGDAPSQRSSVF